MSVLALMLIGFVLGVVCTLGVLGWLLTSDRRDSW